jgi:osmotically-inducible protein OsmY
MNIKTLIFPIVLIAMVGCAATTWRGNTVRDRLSETAGLSTHDISIDERSRGEIVLRGTVSSDHDRNLIERIARDTQGVKNVRNELIVSPSSVSVREGSTVYSNDGRAIVSEIMSNLASSPDVRNYNINAELVGDTVTLRGEVGNERERAAAENIALRTRGVSRVRNEIVVARPYIKSDLQITQDVRETLLRNTNTNLRNVDITTRDGVVTFRGSQSNRREIDRLVSIAQSVNGVRDVRVELTVAGDRYRDQYRQVR